jgi:L-lactate dehydrogenase complex protein LldE
MRVGLFIPCYMDAFEPEVGIATWELLERLDCTVEYPVDQTCCGQPMTNTGCHQDAAGAEALFVKNFSGYDYIVAPSGSRVHQVRVNTTAIEQTPEVRAVSERTFELTEFLHGILKVSEFPWARFPHKIGLHYNCNSSDHSRAGAEYIVSADSSCLLHQKGCARHMAIPSSSCTSPGF